MKNWPSILFADLDGTLINTASGKTFAEDPTDFRIRKDVLDAIRNLKHHGLKHVFIVTNQGGIPEFISERDFETYMELFEHMLSIVKLPDLMIYLRSSVEHLVANIQKRGRDYEQTMQIEYLDNLNRRYEDFITNHYKGRVMIVDKDNLDFENRREDFIGITNRIDSLLYGLFPMKKDEGLEI